MNNELPSGHIRCRTLVFDIFLKEKRWTLPRLAEIMRYHPVSLSRIKSKYEKEGILPTTFVEKAIAYLYNSRQEDREKIRLLFPDWPIEY